MAHDNGKGRGAMRVLVTGSSGHLGRALMMCLPEAGYRPVGLDRAAGPLTDHVGDIADPQAVARAMQGIDAVLHTATLHKPHVATHPRQAFVDTNVTGTLTLLEAARAAGVRRFVLTSTTSAFGARLTPPKGAPAAWIDAWAPGAPKNIYGATKEAAEGLCHLYHRRFGLPCLVLRVARFFPEPDDDPARRAAFADANAKTNEFLNRRVDLEDAATAHLAALAAPADLPFERYVISATTPFRPEDAATLAVDAPAAIRARVPGAEAIYARLGYRLPPVLDRVYDNARARRDLGWRPVYDVARLLAQLEAGQPIGSALARRIGVLGYHGADYADGLYPVADGDSQTPGFVR